MPSVIETTVYELNELSDDAKRRARDWFREGVGDWDWYDSVYEDFESVCCLLGVELRTRPVRLMGGGTRYAPCIYFSGFWSQGDGACFEGTYRYAKDASRKLREYAPQDAELHRIAARLAAVQRRNFYQLRAAITHRGRYYHAHSMDIAVERQSPLYQDTSSGADEEIAEALRDLAHWLYRQLEREWDFMMSDEYADDGIVANEYSFTADGQRFG